MKRPAAAETTAKDVVFGAWYGRGAEDGEANEGDDLLRPLTKPENWNILACVAPMIAQRLLKGSTGMFTSACNGCPCIIEDSRRLPTAPMES